MLCILTGQNWTDCQISKRQLLRQTHMSFFSLSSYILTRELDELLLLSIVALCPGGQTHL